MVQVRGGPGGPVKTMLGYDKLVQSFEALATDARQLQAAQKRSRRLLDELLENAKVTWHYKLEYNKGVESIVGVTHITVINGYMHYCEGLNEH